MTFSSLRRYSPMKRSKLEPGEKPLRRSKRMRPVNRARAAKRYERDFGGGKAFWIRERLCVIPGCLVLGEAAHAKSRGSGGTAVHMLPICHAHHREQHDFGTRTFERKYGLDLLALAAEYESAWQRIAQSTQEGAGMAQNGEP